MTTAKKVSWAKLKVGVLDIGAMTILGVLIFYLTGTTRLFGKETKLYTYMDDAASISKGSPVRLNGILVGEVTAVTLSGENNPRRIVKIAMDVHSDQIPSIPADSIAAISADNVLGTKFINIKKGRGITPVQPNAEIARLDTQGFDELVHQCYSALASLQANVKRGD